METKDNFTNNLIGPLFLCIAMVAGILTVYMQVGNHPFFSFDEVDCITNNPHIENGITGKNIIWAFTSVEAYNWHPITWLSHMSIAHFFGMSPRAHHFANVAIHTATSLLIFLLFLRITGALWQSFFVAALFALHPLHVESVAWVAERKDVLSAFFWFLTLYWYSEYVDKQKAVLYLLTFLSFVLGLMSKSMLVTLPIVLLILDFWPLGRFRNMNHKLNTGLPAGRLTPLIIEKIPFIACSVLTGLITIYAQQKGGVLRGFKEIPFQLRCENALIAYVKYIEKTLWPHDLAFLYPFPLSIALWQVISSLSILLLLSVAAIRSRHIYPYFAAGWFWFLITLVPVIGLIQVGGQSMADRYSYIPVIGLFIVAAWAIPDLLKGFRYRQVILVMAAGAALIGSATLSWQQVGYWHDDITLFRHTLQVTSGDYLIHSFLGAALAEKGDLDAAFPEHYAALRKNPNDTTVHYNLGVALAIKGDQDAALKEYQVALLIDPNNAQAHNNLGLAFTGKGDLDAAIREFQAALLINPFNTKAHNNLGIALARKGDLDAAIREFQATLQLKPNYTKAENNLKHALALKKIQNEQRK